MQTHHLLTDIRYIFGDELLRARIYVERGEQLWPVPEYIWRQPLTRPAGSRLRFMIHEWPRENAFADEDSPDLPPRRLQKFLTVHVKLPKVITLRHFYKALHTISIKASPLVYPRIVNLSHGQRVENSVFLEALVWNNSGENTDVDFFLCFDKEQKIHWNMISQRMIQCIDARMISPFDELVVRLGISFRTTQDLHNYSFWSL